MFVESPRAAEAFQLGLRSGHVDLAGSGFSYGFKASFQSCLEFVGRLGRCRRGLSMFGTDPRNVAGPYRMGRDVEVLDRCGSGSGRKP